MKVKSSLIGLLSLLTVAVNMPQPLAASCKGFEKQEDCRSFKQNVQLQVADFLGILVEDSEFWVTVEVVKQGDEVTVYIPTINFQIAQCANADPDCGGIPLAGTIFTVDGFLPEDCRPGELNPVSIIAATNNGQNTPGSLTITPPANPPPGYIVQVNNDGGLQIQQAAAFGNLIPEGPQILLPCSISYIAKKKEVICKNFIIEKGFTNVTQFSATGQHGTPAGDNIRDSHVNDAYDNLAVWAWTDNHCIDKTLNLLNVYVAVGRICDNGEFILDDPIQLTNFPANTIGWDTSVAINRKDKNNIVVSYQQINYDFSQTFFNGHIVSSFNCRAVSFDGGKSWGGIYDGITSLPFNGLLNFQPPGGQGSGDYPGVSADKYGNFWIATTNFSDSLGNLVNNPYLLVSSDKGVTWDFAYSMPPVLNPQPPAGAGGTNGDEYDYPHIVFGGDGNGNYGVWLYADYIIQEAVIGDLIGAVAFLPITGLGTFGTGETTFLNTLSNTVATPTIAASQDGRFWAWGGIDDSPGVIGPISLFYKSPGDLASNYAGPWQYGYYNFTSEIIPDTFNSLPVFGYFPSVVGLIYDENRRALFALVAVQSPYESQNMRLYFMVSRNNGQSWTKAYDVSTSSFANRGFSSMALDPISGNIFVGWYDGRNDPTEMSLQYFGAIIRSEVLDGITCPIPFSDALISIPDQGSDTPSNS